MNHYHKAISAVILLILLFSMFPASVSEAEVPGYPDYDRISAELEALNREYPSICALHSIGKTYEGRDIWALKISDNPDVEEKDEPDVLIMGGHHAKELISAVVPLMFAQSILENYSKDPEIRHIVNSTEIWIVPVVNPDGYQYAWEGHTGWRKNRRPIDLNGDGIPEGIGVDLNRNYAHHWGEEGASKDPKSDVYCGPAPFSENETRAIRNLVLSHDFVFSVSFHSYGQIIYHPWGNSIDPEPMDEKLMDALAEGMAGYNLYDVMEGKDKYSTTGDSDDWLYANTTCLPFTIEVGKEFIPPPSEIKSIFLKNDGALLYLISMTDNPYGAISPEKTNLRITGFDMKLGNAVIDVENQGNYSVSVNVSVSSEMDRNSTVFLLGAHETREVLLGVRYSDMIQYNASIKSIHGADEWNCTDNSMSWYPPPIVEPPKERAYAVAGILGIMAALGTASYLFYLFKKD